jgi:serine/threonine protein kinase
LASPFGAPASTPLWPRLLAECEAIVANWTVTSRYNNFMDAATTVVQELGLLDAVLDPNKFSGIPYWTKRSCLKYPRSSKVYDVKSVLDTAWGVNAYWQSARNEDEKVKNANERGSSTNIAEGSDWDILKKHVENLGKPLTYTPQQESPSSEKPEVPAVRQSSSLSTLSWPELLVGASRSSCPSITAVSQSSIFKNYALISEVGKGSFGICYKAKHMTTGHVAVVKVTRSDDMNRIIPFTEHYLQRICGSTNTVAIFDVYWSPYYSAILMELCGESLRALCNRRQAAFGDKPVASMFGDISRGLAHMHDKKVLHRDLHVGNILVDNTIKPKGEVKEHQLKAAKIADFGKAIEFDTSSSPGKFLKATATCGAPYIIPPEVWFRNGTVWGKRMRGQNGPCPIPTSKPRRAKYTGALDVWAVGIDLLHVLKVELGGGPLGDRGASSMVAVFGKIPQELVEDLKWSVPKEFLAPLLEKKRELFFDDLGTFAFVFKELIQCDPRTRVTASGAAEMFSILAA